jgi:hypothetical protein
MSRVRVDIVRFVDETHPGIVECSFHDAFGRLHKLVDKLPLFTEERLWTNSSFPQPGLARCEVLERLLDVQGRKVARLTIARPDYLESVDGLSEFEVLESQISEDVSYT